MKNAQEMVFGAGRGHSSRARRARRAASQGICMLESLERRIVLSALFTYANASSVTVAESGGNDSFLVIESGGLLEYSTNGGVSYSGSWGNAGNLVHASSSTTITVDLSGDNSVVQIGDSSAGVAASQIVGTVDVVAANGAANDKAIIDDSH